MIFETERLTVRKFLIDDIDCFMEYRNNANWMKYQSFKGLSREEYINELINDSTVEDGVQLAIINKADNLLIGDLYLSQNKKTLSIGYTINPIHARRGYAYEACKGAIKWAKIRGYEKLEAEVEPDNTASVNLLKKLGFSYIEKNEYDELVYELLIK